MSGRITTCDCGEPAYGGRTQCTLCQADEGLCAPPPASVAATGPCRGRFTFDDTQLGYSTNGRSITEPGPQRPPGFATSTGWYTWAGSLTKFVNQAAATDLPDVPYSGLEERFFKGLNTDTRRAVLQVLGGHTDAFMEQVRTHSDERRLFKHLFKAAPVSDAAKQDGIEAAELQTLLLSKFACYRPTHPAGLMAWAKIALLDCSPHRAAPAAQGDACEGCEGNCKSCPHDRAAAQGTAKPPFTKGDTFPSGDCGHYESGIHNVAGNHWQAIVCYGDTAEKADTMRDQVLDALLAPSTRYEKFGYILQAADGSQAWLKGDPAAGMERYGKVIQVYKKGGE